MTHHATHLIPVPGDADFNETLFDCAEGMSMDDDPSSPEHATFVLEGEVISREDFEQENRKGSGQQADLDSTRQPIAA